MAAPTIFDTVAVVFHAPGGAPQQWRTVGALDHDATVKGVVVVVTTSLNAPLAHGARWGGVTIPLAVTSGGSANRRQSIFFLDDLTGIDSGDTVEIYAQGGPYVLGAIAYAIAHTSDLSLLDADAQASVQTTLLTLSLDSGDAEALAISCAGNYGYYSGNLNAGAGQVVDLSDAFSYHRVKACHEGITGAGTQTYAHNQDGMEAAGVLVGGLGFLFEPVSFGAEVGFADGVALVVGSTVHLFATRFGAEAGFQSGTRFRTAGARQLMLTGGGIETPEMTQGGFEGQILTFHARRVPTWEDGPTSVIEAKGDLIVGTGPGTVDNLPAGIDGWFLSLDAAEPTGLRWVSPSGATVDFGETADIAALDFGDTAAAGSTGEVADAGHVHGMPGDPVAALALAKGDLIVAAAADTPARLPVGSDGEILTAAAAAPTGVTWAPPAEGTPPALRVFLYATFK